MASAAADDDGDASGFNSFAHDDNGVIDESSVMGEHDNIRRRNRENPNVSPPESHPQTNTQTNPRKFYLQWVWNACKRAYLWFSTLSARTKKTLVVSLIAVAATAAIVVAVFAPAALPAILMATVLAVTYALAALALATAVAAIVDLKHLVEHPYIVEQEILYTALVTLFHNGVPPPIDFNKYPNMRPKYPSGVRPLTFRLGALVVLLLRWAPLLFVVIAVFALLRGLQVDGPEKFMAFSAALLLFILAISIPIYRFQVPSWEEDVSSVADSSLSKIAWCLIAFVLVGSLPIVGPIMKFIFPF